MGFNTIKYFIFSILVMCIACFPAKALAEVCLSDEEAVDVITLLDSSERNTVILGSCEKLVKDLYSEVEQREEKIVNITNELITAKQEALDYQKSRDTWREVALISGAANIVFTLAVLLPLL